MPRFSIDSKLESHIGGKIAEYRKANGITQKQLAEALNITPQQMHKYEKGTNRLTASNLMIICLKFDVSPAYFFATWSESFEQESALIAAYKKLDPRRKLSAIRLMKDMQPGESE